jgi:hypothetical protein
MHDSPVDESSDHRGLRRAVRLAVAGGFAQMLYCWKCSDPNPDHYRFCGQCGAPAERSGSSGSSATTETKASVLESVKALLDSPASSRIIEIKSATSDSYGVHLLNGKSDETRRFVIEENGERKEYASLEEMPEDLRKRLESAIVIADEKLWEPVRVHTMESLIRRFRRPYPFDAFPSNFSKTPDWAMPPASLARPATPPPAPDAKEKKSGLKWWFWLLAIYGLYKLLT